jgi:hypothetical protein
MALFCFLSRPISVYGTGYTEPTVTTQAVTGILICSAVGNGNVTDGESLDPAGHLLQHDRNADHGGLESL